MALHFAKIGLDKVLPMQGWAEKWTKTHETAPWSAPSVPIKRRTVPIKSVPIKQKKQDLNRDMVNCPNKTAVPIKSVPKRRSLYTQKVC